MSQLVQPPVDDRPDYAEMLRELYMVAYRSRLGDDSYGREPIPQWDGGMDVWGTNRTAVWPRLAKLLVDRDIDPHLFISAQFDQAMKPPVPTALLNGKALTIYRRYSENQPQILQQMYESGRLALLAHAAVLLASGVFNELSAMRRAIQDTVTVDAPSWVRYIVAADEGFQDIAGILFPAALRQYTFQARVFEHVFGDRIPLQLREAGQRTRADITRASDANR